MLTLCLRRLVATGAILGLCCGTTSAATSPVHGTVVSVDAAQRQILLRHDPFPAMPMAMTMACRVKDPRDLKKLYRGAVIDATVDTAGDPWVLTNIRVKPKPAQPPAKKTGAARAAPADAAAPQTGTFALQGGRSEVQARLAVRPERDPLVVRLDLWETTVDTTRTIRAYDTDQTKKLHLIAVSDDLETFLHVHPALGSDGHFRIALRAPRPAIYHLYADAYPHGLDQQVFRFDVPIGDPRGAASPRLTPTARTATVGPYAVSFDSLTVDAGHLTMLTARVRKGGAPARDLHPYLGAMAHAVFVDVRDLSYVHTHPMALSEMSHLRLASRRTMRAPMDEMPDLAPSARVEPEMMLHVVAREPGTYKLWFQFQGGSQLYVAPFVVQAQ